MKCLQAHAMYDMYGTSVFCFHLIINSAGFEKNSVVFFSFVVRFRLVILFYSYFSICWLDFSPTSDFPTEATIVFIYRAFVISSCNLILFSGENCLFHMENFSLLKLLFYKLLFVKTLH